ncbi:MAG: LysR family transcriptional regulator [Magnetococcales bacterium]|nr:LysR family transcriptional regulator [Magnetococcales bacterium]
MDQLNAMRVFIVVADLSSFSAAARHLGLSTSAVSKLVTALENHLDCTLMQRTTRKLHLTEEGLNYLGRCRQIITDLEEADRGVGMGREELSGRIRVTAPVVFGQLYMGDVLTSFMERYPKMEVDLALSDNYVDLVSEGVDLAIRIGQLSDSSLMARQLAPFQTVACASPAFLDRHGAPENASALADLPWLIYTLHAQDAVGVVRVKAPDGSERRIKVNGPLRCNNGGIIRQAAIGGLGITVSPLFIVGDDLAAGRLVQLLQDHRFLEGGIYAVYPANRYLSTRVRRFIDHLAENWRELSQTQ